MEKTCGICGFAGNKHEFQSGKNKCKVCANTYQKAYYDAHPAQRSHNRRLCSESKKARKARNKAFIDELKAHPCTDCGRSFPPVAMDFDHLDATLKEDKVSKLATRAVSLQVLAAEIAKCELVCAVCHRIRTQRRSATNEG